MSSLVEKEKKKALTISIKEGSAASAAVGFGDSFIVPLAEAMKANALHIGILSALSGLLNPLAQYFGNKLMERHSRKVILRKFTFLQALTWLPIAILALLYWKNIISSSAAWFLIIFYALIAIFEGLIYPSWFSWMGDIVPEKERGKYFGRRSAITGSVSVIVSILGAIIVNQSKVLGISLIALSLMFFLAFIFRTISFSYFKKQYSPPFKLNKKYEFSLLDFVKRFDNYGKFAVYQMFFNLAIMIASPFFGFYMLRELGYSSNLVLFMIVTMSSSVFTLLFYPLVGKISDKYGNLKLVYLANILFVINPILWIFFKEAIWLIIFPGLCAGLANAAMLIGNRNFTYDSVSKEKRGTCIAYTNILAGVGTFIGSIIGGLLLKELSLDINSYFLVFTLAAFARLLVAIIFLPSLKEVRKVDSMHINPMKTIHHEINGFGSFLAHPIAKKGIFRKL